MKVRSDMVELACRPLWTVLAVLIAAAWIRSITVWAKRFEFDPLVDFGIDLSDSVLYGSQVSYLSPEGVHEIDFCLWEAELASTDGMA